MCSVTQSCLTLCSPMDCSLPGSSVHGIFLARILERYLLQSIKHVSTRMLSATSRKTCNSSFKKKKVNLLIHRTLMAHDKFGIRKGLIQQLHDVLKIQFLFVSGLLPMVSVLFQVCLCSCKMNVSTSLGPSVRTDLLYLMEKLLIYWL